MHGVLQLSRFLLLRASSRPASSSPSWFPALLRMQSSAGSAFARFNSNYTYNYEAAIDALNSLQSNAEYLRNRRSKAPESGSHEALRAACIGKMCEFLARSHIDVDKLPAVIHVTGTKGKGTTCAFCESILRRHGYTTGFFSSPHLLNVTERIRINGKPIDDQRFAQTFWEVYTALSSTKSPTDGSRQMPIYFQMIMLIAFKVFIAENVDVAILEVGIGGEYDPTNVVSTTQVVGITSLGLDHTQLLGNTIEAIAWHKAGIMRPGVTAFTMPQGDDAMNVLRRRAAETNCKLEIVNANEELPNVATTMPPEIYKLNASFAIKLAQAWMGPRGRTLDRNLVEDAVQSCEWQGRFQILSTSTGRFFLDGAHTSESITHCARWYQDNTHTNSLRVLIFNSTGERNVDRHLQILHECRFDRVYFVPNIATTKATTLDNINYNCPTSEQLIRSMGHCGKWSEMFPHEEGVARALPSVNDAILDAQQAGGKQHETLITGSLHLVGASLQVLNATDNKLMNKLRN